MIRFSNWYCALSKSFPLCLSIRCLVRLDLICGKSTTTGILAHLMNNDGYRVLAIDMDSQGNLTELLSGESSNEFIGKSVLEAMQQNNVKEFLYSVNENLDLLPANNFLLTFARWIYTGKTYTGDIIPF